MTDGFIAEGKEAVAWSAVTGWLGLQLLLPPDAFPQAFWIISVQGVALSDRLIGLTTGVPVTVCK